MSFLTSIAARAAGLAPAVEPRLPSRFEREADAPSFAEVENNNVGRGLNPSPSPAAERPVVSSSVEQEQQQQQPAVAADGLRTRPVSDSPPPQLPQEEAPLRALIETTHVLHEHESVHETTREIIERRADFQSAVDGPPVHRPPAPEHRETVVRPEVERLRTGGPRAERRESAPTIRVTIGRVDVRAVTEPAPAPAKREPAKRAVFTIEDYIRLRREGRR
jgi:hypothetical protein